MTPAELKHLSRPFDPQVLRAARELAERYRLVISAEPGMGYLGRTMELPEVMADAPTIEKCAREVLEATTVAIATMLEAGQTPPSPASEGRRDQQVNLRLTAEEKMLLEAAAGRDGFRSLSDYIRASALNRAG